MKTKEFVSRQLPSDKFETYFELIAKILLLLGVKIDFIGDKKIGNSDVRETIPWSFWSFLILGTFSVAGEYFYIRDSMQKNEIFLAAQVTSHLLSNVICIAKGYRLIFTLSDLEETLRELSSLWRKYLFSHEIRGEFFEKADKTALFCKMFIYATLSAVLSFCLPPVYNLFNEYLHRRDVNYTHDFEQRIFFFKYPFEVNSFPRYLSVMLGEGYLLVGAGLMWVVSDVMFAQLTTHISLQLQVLQYDMTSLINDNIGENILKRALKKLIRRHQEILRICDQLEYTYSPAILSTVLLSGINICFNVFEARETISKGNYADATVHIFLFAITFLQILFYCTFAEGLTQESIMVANAVYNSNWAEKNSVLGVYLQIVIMRSQKPFYCTAYGFFPIGHTRLNSILNGAYSYYMMLQAGTK